jgi:hypothetical protein
MAAQKLYVVYRKGVPLQNALSYQLLILSELSNELTSCDLYSNVDTREIFTVSVLLIGYHSSQGYYYSHDV